MCGICGIFDLKQEKRIDASLIKRMTSTLHHRGPDGENHYTERNLGYGFSRLSIIDLAGGMQPLFNEDKSLVLICNGEIFNYIELREELINKGHCFKTQTDVEVLLHLYEENSNGTEFLNRLNGQFSFAICDLKKQQLFCARDHFGVLPFFYTIADDLFIFGSEIKAILEHPAVKREVDLVGLDQVFTFPGLISPRTMFKNIRSLENGHYLTVKTPGDITDYEYWDVIYPNIDEIDYKKFNEQYYIEQVKALISQSVKLRLRSDVPVGFYISGGLDSSITTAVAHRLLAGVRSNSFSIDFIEKDISESKYQRIMAKFVDSLHHEIVFRFTDISERLVKSVYHSECPVKETYNTASLALSELVRANDIKVILTGEGSDEFFAGYVGYRFDKMRQMQKKQATPDTPFEEAIRQKIYGDGNFFYEKNKYAFTKTKKELYSQRIHEIYDEVDCLNHYIIKKERLINKDIIHKRSYLDYKLRLADHLISDHGDRMAMANSVEARYPFLDKDLIEFAATVPPDLKLKDFDEKYIVKKAAKGLIPEEILKREKFGFVAPGSPYLLQRNIQYIDELLSYEKIKKQGYFNPDTVETLKKQYMQEGFRLNVPFDSDLLIIVITFGILLEQFNLPDF
ncbi:MAG: asparagine synthase (glutamine-hydrolyzing) [Candidatus Aminicenantes bacterium]|nr:asparagine synthase (glutamine-hydrolyzing) [Candidatus Aminicenantes bacterium]